MCNLPGLGRIGRRLVRQEVLKRGECKSCGGRGGDNKRGSKSAKGGGKGGGKEEGVKD